MKFARWVFTAAAIYGVIVLVPPLFLEATVVRMSGRPMGYPEDYYGFTLTAIVFQVLFFAIGRDPQRYRPLMLVCVLEKVSFGVPVWVLYAQHRLGQAGVLPFATIDLGLGVLFATSYLRTPKA